MSILEIFRWIQDTAPMTALRESALLYPIVMTGHLTGMALFGGMIAITDLRLLGWAMRSSSAVRMRMLCLRRASLLWLVFIASHCVGGRGPGDGPRSQVGAPTAPNVTLFSRDIWMTKTTAP